MYNTNISIECLLKSLPIPISTTLLRLNYIFSKNIEEVYVTQVLNVFKYILYNKLKVLKIYANKMCYKNLNKIIRKIRREFYYMYVPYDISKLSANII